MDCTIPSTLDLTTHRYRVRWCRNRILSCKFSNYLPCLVAFETNSPFQVPTQAYIIDAFPLHSASALAGNSLLRSVVGGTLPLAAPSLYAKLGYGWGNSLLGFLALAFGGLPILFYKYGEVLRKKFPVNLDD